MLHPDLDLRGVKELVASGLVKQYLKFSSFEGPKLMAESSGSRHKVYRTSLDGTPCVLKEYVLFSAKDRARLLKEASFLHRLRYIRPIPVSCLFEIGQEFLSKKHCHTTRSTRTNGMSKPPRNKKDTSDPTCLVCGGGCPRHPCVADLFGVVFDEEKSELAAYLQMRFYEGGDLKRWRDLFWTTQRIAAPEQDHPELHGITHDILEGVRFLHANKVVHCDLKLENIFVTEHGQAVLGDFDISKDTGTITRHWIKRHADSLRAPHPCSRAHIHACGDDGGRHAAVYGE